MGNGQGKLANDLYDQVLEKWHTDEVAEAGDGPTVDGGAQSGVSGSGDPASLEGVRPEGPSVQELRASLLKLGVEETRENDIPQLVGMIAEKIDELSYTQLFKAINDLGVLIEEPQCEEKERPEKYSQTNVTYFLNQVIDVNFWRTYWTYHPHSDRVKNWLSFHDSLRERCTEILKSAALLKTGKCSAKTLRNMLDKFHNRTLKNHSDFEDEQLFRFFNDNFKDPVNTSLFEVISEQHVNCENLGTEILEACTSARGKETEIYDKLLAYEQDLLWHLECEEKSLLHLWLNLNDTQYEVYRKYLKGFYALRY